MKNKLILKGVIFHPKYIYKTKVNEATANLFNFDFFRRREFEAAIFFFAGFVVPLSLGSILSCISPTPTSFAVVETFGVFNKIIRKKGKKTTTKDQNL